MQAWDEFLENLEKKFHKKTIDKWLRSLKVENFDACNLYLSAQDPFQISFFEEHIRDLAKKEFRNNNHHVIKIHFKTLPKSIKKHIQNTLTPTPLEIKSDPIDPLQFLNNFIADSKENSFTLRFFQELQPGTYNPIFLYGPPGVGKTHLLMGLAKKLQKQNLSVFLVHSETFTEHVVWAIRNSQMQDFRKNYRNQDVLIIDDVHHLARKNATQEELFHTFNTLHTDKRQIILSSHLPPNQIIDIEPRLISRFEWGVLLKLQKLSSPCLRQVLKNRAQHHQFVLLESIIDFLIEHFSSSTKALMRSFDALLIRYKKNHPLSLEETKDLLTDLLDVEEKTHITQEKIIQTTSSYFGIRPSDILGKSQAKEYVLPRKIAMYLCREKLKMPYLAIGRFFHRDHSTVMVSIKQIFNKKTLEEIGTFLEEIECELIKEKG